MPALNEGEVLLKVEASALFPWDLRSLPEGGRSVPLVGRGLAGSVAKAASGVDSFAKGEISAATTGLSYRWAIKATVPFGSVLLLIAGIGVFCRSLLGLRRIENR